MPNFSNIIESLQERQSTMKKEQDLLFQKNQEALQENPDLSGAEVYRKYVKLISKDQKDIELFNAKLKSYASVEEGDYPITTNKMSLIFPNVSLLEDGEIPPYDNTISSSDDLPKLGNGEFWGSSLSTFYSTTLLYRLSAITDKKVIEIMPLNSSIFHIAPIKTSLAFHLEEHISIDKSYIFQEDNNLGFGFPHSGFTFGGSRTQEVFYSNILSKLGVKTKYFPEDCSSWIASIFGQTYNSSTADLLCAYRCLSKSTDYVPTDWKQQPMAVELLEKFVPIDATREQPLPGDMYVCRNFNESHQLHTSLGISGHVGLIFSHLGNSIKSIEFSRDMPKIEGFGTKEIVLKDLNTINISDVGHSTFQKKLYYLRPKKEI